MSLGQYLPLLACLLILAPATPAADPDPAGPKAAMKRFYEAMESGDPAAVRQLLHTTNDSDKALADAFAAQLTAAKTLGEAAKTKFSATGDALSKGLPLRDEIAKLNQAEEIIDGDNATLKIPGQAKSLKLVKSQGQWRVSIIEYAGATPENIAAQTAVLKDMATAFTSVATDILADKFPTAAEAQRTLQQKMQSVLYNTLQKRPPTTAKAAPATPKPSGE